MSPAQPTPFLKPGPSAVILGSGQFTIASSEPVPIPISIGSAVRLRNQGPARVYVGNSSVTPTNGHVLAPGETESFAPGDLCAVVDPGGQAKVSWYG